MQVVLTLMLSSVALKFVVSQSLPVISYLTLLDKYLITSFFYLFLVVLQNSVVYWISDNDVAKIVDKSPTTK